MTSKLGQAKAEARKHFGAGDYPRALRWYDRILAAMPADHETRLRIADVFAKLGLTDEARDVYRQVAGYDLLAGHPLAAVVACRALDTLGAPAEDLLARIAETYGTGSPSLTRFAIRPAPPDPETPLDLGPIADTDPFDDLVAAARARALDVGGLMVPQQHHPLPFLSELDPRSLLAVLQRAAVRRLADGELVVRQGEPGTSLYLVAGGELRVLVTGSDNAEREVARLYENTLFGEMALITSTPRGASVAVVGEADVLEVSREALAHVTTLIPAVATELDRFARERLIKNLLATSPLFTPFTKDQQSELLRRFEGVEVEAGTEVIREGEQGTGLFVALSGELEAVSRAGGGEPVVLGRLRTGDIFGEMSLLTHQPTSATVRALGKCMLLFLDRTYVERLAGAVPEVRAYFSGVASRRSQDNTLRLGASPLPAEGMEVDLDDLLL
jgi:CRP-like cAMP-binding protein